MQKEIAVSLLRHKRHKKNLRLLLVAFQDGVEELEDELLLFAGEEFDLFELALKLGLRAGLGS